MELIAEDGLFNIKEKILITFISSHNLYCWDKTKISCVPCNEVTTEDECNYG